MRCELTVRAFSHIRELTRVDFQGYCVSTRVEGFALSLVRDVKILYNFMNSMIGKCEMFYLFSHLQRLTFMLYGHYVKYIKRQQIDETGYNRLRGSLFHLKVELDQLVPKLLG
jgi:hypothetical protein